jgi:SPP1 gp7 family putative phage head morphogenesis protein
LKNAEYWRRRFELLEESQNRAARESVADVERQFGIAQRAIDDKIHAWYSRFADNNEIGMAEAKKLLVGKELAEFKWDVNEYIKQGKANALDQRWMKQLENASSRVHVSRLEALKMQAQHSMENLFTHQHEAAGRLMKRVYLDNYHHSMYEVQRGAGVGWDIAGINERQLDSIISKPWTADGITFSDRIWHQKNKLIDEVHTQLTQNIILGRRPDETIKAIGSKLQASRANAGRLAMTESAYFANQAQKDAYKELSVDRIEILGTLDSKTCELCGSFDGKVMTLTESSAGVTSPPFHPWCRCTAVPYFDDDAGERIARNVDGDTYHVPADMKFEDWKKAFVDSKGKNGIINKDNVMYRQKTNTGVYKHLSEPMRLNHVKKIAAKYNIDLHGIHIKIEKQKEAIGTGYTGLANPDCADKGKIHLLPDAFKNEIELAKTIYHEKTHLEQYAKHGYLYVIENRKYYEDEADYMEEVYFSKSKKT